MRKELLVFIAVLLVSNIAAAHSPSGMSFDYREGDLSVTVSHSVSSPNSHYVKRVTVSSGGENLDEKVFDSQETGGEHSLVFKDLEVGPGDTVTVRAECSISGSLESDYSIPGVSDGGQDDTMETQVPSQEEGYNMWWIIGLAGVLLAGIGWFFLKD